MTDIAKITKELSTILSSARFEHCLLVAEEAKSLAQNYKIDPQPAYIAGLLHDIAKEFTSEENAKLIKKYNLSVTLLNPEYQKMVHADLGAKVIKEKYHLNEDICNAVKYHTIGDKSMNLLAKIVFIADKIGRKNLKPEFQEIKKMAYQNIDKALEKYIKINAQKLESKGLKLHPKTKELLSKLQNNETY